MRAAARPTQTVKIGEGTYGEVFRGPPSAEYLDSVPEGDEAPASLVVKIIPMEGDLEFNGAPQKGAGDLMAEAVIALTLSGLRAEEAPGGGRPGGRVDGGSSLPCKRARFRAPCSDAWW